MGEWREEFILGKRKKWGTPPTEACNPQHCHLFFDSTGGQDDSQIFGPEGLLGATLPGAQSLFGSPALHFHPQTLL